MATPLWARLDTRHFVTLAEVVSTGSFTAAAESLGYTQSAVSQQIARLERMLGQPVLHRSAGGRTVSLTPAGRVLLQHASSLVATMQRAAADVSALSQGIAGILRVGCFESVGNSLLPAALASFLDDYPRVQLELTELADDGDLLDLVAGDELDLTFVVFPLAPGPYESQALLEDPYVLVVAEDSPMAGIPGAVDLNDYPELPLMSYGKMREVHAIETRLGRPVYGSRVVFRSNHTSTPRRQNPAPDVCGAEPVFGHDCFSACSLWGTSPGPAVYSLAASTASPCTASTDPAASSSAEGSSAGSAGGGVWSGSGSDWTN